MPQRITDQAIVGDILHEWIIQEYERHERGRRWYLLMGILGILLVGYGLFTDNFLFALIIILFAIILFLQSHQEPIQLSFRITETGILIGDKFYPYSELENFYIIYQPPHIKTLFFDTKSFYRPLLRIPLFDENPVEIRFSLLEFLPEDTSKEEEPLSDTFGRNWKIH